MRILKLLSAPAGALVLLAALATYLVAPALANLIWLQFGLGMGLVLLGSFLNFSEMKDRLRGRAVREGTGDVAYIIIVALVLILVNFLAVRHHKRIDLTEQGEYSLSEQTQQILASLPREVEARAYYYDGSGTQQGIEDLLEEYEYHGGGKFGFHLIDPIKNPAQAKEDGITQEDSLVLHSGDRSDTVVGGDEEQITTAILKVIRDETKTLCFAIGHGEKNIEEEGPQGLTSFRLATEKQQTQVRTFSPAMGVPAECAAVVVAGPQMPWLPPEAEKLSEYLKGGGRAALLLDPSVESGLEELMAGYGISLGNDVVVDRVSSLFGGQPDIPMVPADGYETHPITKGFQYQTFYPLATSLLLTSSVPEGVELKPLASTSSLSWGEKSYAEEAPTGTLSLDPEDQEGPLVVAAAATREVTGMTPAEFAQPDGEDPQEAEPTTLPSDPQTRLVVFGDSDFPTNSYFNATGNGELFLNVTSWLSGQEELVAIRPNSPLPRMVMLTQQQATLIWILSIFVVPLGIVTAGGVIWIRRKKL